MVLRLGQVDGQVSKLLGFDEDFVVSLFQFQRSSSHVRFERLGEYAKAFLTLPKLFFHVYAR